MMKSNNLKGDNILETEVAAEVIAAIVDMAVKKYKIDAGMAGGIVREAMEKHLKFMQLLGRGATLKEIRKTRAYDEVETNARRRIYFELRRYQKDVKTREALISELSAAPGDGSKDIKQIITRLAQSHVSTNERLGSQETFYEELFKYTGVPLSIVDVGCGLHPLLFPFAEVGNEIAHYVALDKDKTSISTLEAFSKTLHKNILHPVHWNINEGWRAVHERTGMAHFEVAFLMKLVPVVFRIRRELLTILLDTPAQTWVLTGSRTAMTKYKDIEKRERKIIKQFIKRSGKQIIGEFSIADEFCIIVR